MDTTEKTHPYGESKKPVYDLGVEWKDLDLRKFMVIGSTVYLAECAIIYPFDLIKTQLQVDKGSTSFFKDARRRTKEIVRTQGIRGLYHGYWPSTLFSLPSQALYILSYNYFKDALERKYPSTSHHQRGHRPWVTLTAGAVADVVSHVLFTPVDVVVQRMQLPNSAQQFRNSLEVTKFVIKEEGFAGLYRGFGATMVTHAPASAIWWTTYETCKTYLSDHDPRETLFGYQNAKLQSIDKQRQTNADESHQTHLVQNYFAQITGGVIAGVLTSVAMNPFDVVKTRLQTQNRKEMTRINEATGKVESHYYKNIFSGMSTVVRTEGFKALMKGVGPRIMAFAPMSGLSSLLYEFVMKSSRKTD